MNRFFTLSLILLGLNLTSQTIHEEIGNIGIYDLLDELATLHLIDINSAVKPYSKTQIAHWLNQVSADHTDIPLPLRAAIQQYKTEYSSENHLLPTGYLKLIRPTNTTAIHLLPPEISYKDSLLRITLRPIYGIRYISSTNGDFYHSYGGASFSAYAGDHWAAWASIRDNYQTLEPLALPTYLTTEPGGNYKIGVQGRKGAEFSEMRGGITYSWNWGSFGLVKDYIQWGDSYNGSNIFSGRNPSFPLIKLHLKPAEWIEFTYFHGWLISQIIDSTRSYYTTNGDFRAVFRQKYIAANMYTFKPFKQFRLSVGNSIVYSDVPVQPAYLIPFFFFKSLDHTLNKGIDNQNSAMFMNISSRQIKHIHLFGTIFIDEFSFSRIRNPDRHNFWSVKAGASLQNWPIKSVSLTTEFTRTSPLTYKHRVPATTFTSNNFNLGHYLLDNSEELFFMIKWSPLPYMKIQFNYTNAWHANEYQYVFGKTKVDENPILKDKTWSSKITSFRIEYKPIHYIVLFAEYDRADIQGYEADGQTAEYYLKRFSPKYMHGKTNTVQIGFMMGI